MVKGKPVSGVYGVLGKVLYNVGSGSSLQIQGPRINEPTKPQVTWQKCSSRQGKGETAASNVRSGGIRGWQVEGGGVMVGSEMKSCRPLVGGR